MEGWSDRIINGLKALNPDATPLNTRFNVCLWCSKYDCVELEQDWVSRLFLVRCKKCDHIQVISNEEIYFHARPALLLTLPEAVKWFKENKKKELKRSNDADLQPAKRLKVDEEYDYTDMPQLMHVDDIPPQSCFISRISFDFNDNRDNSEIIKRFVEDYNLSQDYYDPCRFDIDNIYEYRRHATHGFRTNRGTILVHFVCNKDSNGPSEEFIDDMREYFDTIT